MIEAGSLLTDSLSLPARIADAMKAAKEAGDIEAYGILAAAETGIGTVCNILRDPRLPSHSDDPLLQPPAAPN